MIRDLLNMNKEHKEFKETFKHVNCSKCRKIVKLLEDGKLEEHVCINFSAYEMKHSFSARLQTALPKSRVWDEFENRRRRFTPEELQRILEKNHEQT